MSHTATPWALEHVVDNVLIGGHPHKVWLVENPEYGVCAVVLPHEDKTDEAEKDREATARFIVESGNAHAALMQDTQRLYDALKEILENNPACCGDAARLAVWAHRVMVEEPSQTLAPSRTQNGG